MSAIEVRHLSRLFQVRTKPEGLAASVRALFTPQYKTVEAVRDVSFTVEAGESIAFLGPNGAGKSTTIKMLTGILQPSGGTMRVLGLDPTRDRKQLAYHIGTVFGQKSQLWYHLPPADSFRLLGAVYEIPPPILKRRIGDLVERFDLADLMETPVRKLSLGQRIRCELAASLLHRPRLLFLDEPTIGLDVVVKQEIRKLLLEWNRDEKVTIFLTSHDIGDVEKLCRRAILIHHGTLVLDESLKTLKHQATAKKIVGVRYADRPGQGGAEGYEGSGAGSVLRGREGIVVVKETADAAKFEIDTSLHSVHEVIAVLAAQGELADITVEDEPLENLIAGLYRSTSKEEAHGMVARSLA